MPGGNSGLAEVVAAALTVEAVMVEMQMVAESCLVKSSEAAGRVPRGASLSIPNVA